MKGACDRKHGSNLLRLGKQSLAAARTGSLSWTLAPQATLHHLLWWNRGDHGNRPSQDGFAIFGAHGNDRRQEYKETEGGSAIEVATPLADIDIIVELDDESMGVA